MKTHGMGSRNNPSKLYQKWSGMKRRCLNKNDKSYSRYGAKGITVCEKWLRFEGFLEDMGKSFKPGLSIERIDNSKGYSKKNCKWIPLNQQSKNRSVVPIYRLGKIKMTAPDWDKMLNLKEGTIYSRINVLKWDIRRALTTVKKKPTYIIYDKERNKYRFEYWNKGKVICKRFDTFKEAESARDEFIHSLLCK